MKKHKTKKNIPNLKKVLGELNRSKLKKIHIDQPEEPGFIGIPTSNPSSCLGRPVANKL